MGNLKKYWPAFIFLAGLVVFGGVFLFVKSKGKNVVEDEVVAELPMDQKPVASLTPNEDGHWLKLVVDGLGRVQGASTMDYELLYKVDSRTQGVPGTIKLEGKDDIERDLLLGSESSGNFYYDEGVNEGTLTLRFRNAKGKLVGKVSTQWYLQNDESKLTMAGSDFSYILDEEPEGIFFVIMETFGLPEMVDGVISGPYGVFSSSEEALLGKVSGVDHYWTGTAWEELVGGKASDMGIFVKTSK